MFCHCWCYQTDPWGRKEYSYIREICLRILCAMCRDQLAVICGHNDWREWKEKTGCAGDDVAANTSMMHEATVILERDSEDLSKYWKSIGRKPFVLEYIF